jgi:hypothetical protein
MSERVSPVGHEHAAWILILPQAYDRHSDLNGRILLSLAVARDLAAAFFLYGLEALEYSSARPAAPPTVCCQVVGLAAAEAPPSPPLG